MGSEALRKILPAGLMVNGWWLIVGGWWLVGWSLVVAELGPVILPAEGWLWN